MRVFSAVGWGNDACPTDLAELFRDPEEMMDVNILCELQSTGYTWMMDFVVREGRGRLPGLCTSVWREEGLAFLC